MNNLFLFFAFLCLFGVMAVLADPLITWLIGRSSV